VTSKNTNLYAYLKFALDHAQKTGTWVVVVCPEGEFADECRSLISGLFPEGSKFGGRTLRMPSGAKLSITTANDEVFVPEDIPFTTLFVGWSTSGQRSDTKGLSAWRARASQTLDVMAQTNVVSA
jgi:hypothetical protein